MSTKENPNCFLTIIHIIQDDIFQRLTTFPNVLITGHQGFFTLEALEEIAKITVNNIMTGENAL
jgi:D-lactate dehydrogenase